MKPGPKRTKRLTRKEAQFLCLIVRDFMIYQRFPTHREMRDYGIYKSTSSCAYILNVLREKGFLFCDYSEKPLRYTIAGIEIKEPRWLDGVIKTYGLGGD